MFGEEYLIGKAEKRSIDSKNRIIFPNWTMAEAGDIVFFYKEGENIYRVYSKKYINNILTDLNNIELTDEESKIVFNFVSNLKHANIDKQRRVLNATSFTGTVDMLGDIDNVILTCNLNSLNVKDYEKNTCKKLRLLFNIRKGI